MFLSLKTIYFHFSVHMEDNGCLSHLQIYISGNSLVVWWLGLHNSTAVGTGLIHGQGTKIPHAVWHGQKKKKIHHRYIHMYIKYIHMYTEYI